MGQVIKAYFSIFLMMLLGMTGIGLITAETELCKARDFKTDAVIALENSNYSQSVIEEWKSQAEEEGYSLEIIPYGQEEKIQMAEVILSYSYQMSPFHTKEMHTIRGYGR